MYEEYKSTIRYNLQGCRSMQELPAPKQIGLIGGLPQVEQQALRAAA